MVASLELSTERLLLRTPRIEDANAVQSIAADPRVALSTASIPHPYPEGGAKNFILHVQKMANRDRRNLAIVLRNSNELIGMIGYQVSEMEAELAYMVSPIYWGLGSASEACRRIVAHVFDATEANAVIARAMTDNKASEAVLRKAGLRWQSEILVELPVRAGTFPTSCWRLDRQEFRSLSSRGNTPLRGPTWSASTACIPDTSGFRRANRMAASRYSTNEADVPDLSMPAWGLIGFG